MTLTAWLDTIPVSRRIPDLRDFSTRVIPASYIVCHTTGSGVLVKAAEAGKKTPSDIAKFACEYYSKSGNDVSTHLLVDWEGNVWQLLPLTVDGWHSGWNPKMKELYASDAWQGWSRPVNGVLAKKPPRGNYAAWKALFPGKKSPAELLPPGASSPNKGSISVDLLARPYKETWTPEQLMGFTNLLGGLTTMIGTRNIYPHSYLDPVSRMTQTVKGVVIEKAWDPAGWELIKPF